jgi:hypothetical protein
MRGIVAFLCHAHNPLRKAAAARKFQNPLIARLALLRRPMSPVDCLSAPGSVQRLRFAARPRGNSADAAAGSQPLCHLLEHHLGGAAADGLHAGIPRHALDDRTVHVAHAAVELQTVVHHLVDERAGQRL